VGTKIDVST